MRRTGASVTSDNASDRSSGQVRGARGCSLQHPCSAGASAWRSLGVDATARAAGGRRAERGADAAPVSRIATVERERPCGNVRAERDSGS